MTADTLVRRYNLLFVGRHRGLFPEAEGGALNGFLWFVLTPASLLVLFLAAGVFVPYFWLYPERHAARVDFEGTDAQKEVIAQYRGLLSRKPFWRRVAEKLGLVQSVDPPYPRFDSSAT